MKLRRARTIKKALKYCDPQKPLWDDKEREAFYVSREGSPLNEMQRVLREAPDFPKLLFSGPPGCGKSTELAKLKENLNKKFFIILFSAKWMTNNFELVPEMVLYHILRLVGDLAQQRRLKVFQDKADPLIKRWQGWETKEAEIDPNQNQVDPNMYEKVEKGDVAQKGKFKLVSKTFGRPTLNELIGAINDVCRELLKRRFPLFRAKKVLLLISDLDKLDYESARNIFVKSLLSLTKLNCCAVFTFPLGLKYDRDFVRTYRYFSGIYFLENFCLIDRDETPIESSYEQLELVIKKRLRLKLLYPQVVSEVIRNSGGILFELINILRHCCIISRRERVNFIDEAILEEALERIRINFKQGLTDAEIENLKAIYQKKELRDTAILNKLLNRYYITEYGRGEEVWYDVNPILQSIILEPEMSEE